MGRTAIINATSQVIRAILKNIVQKVTGSHAISTSIHMMQIAVIPITPSFFIAVFSLTKFCGRQRPPSCNDNSVKTVTDCADKCVRTPDASIVTGGTFGGVCRCLYDAGMLNTNTIVPAPTKGENVPSMISPPKTNSLALCDSGDGGRIDIIRWHSRRKGKIHHHRATSDF